MFSERFIQFSYRSGAYSIPLLPQVRQLFNDAGRTVNEALPSMPVQVLGWRTLPLLGDQVLAVESEVTTACILASF